MQGGWWLWWLSLLAFNTCAAAEDYRLDAGQTRVSFDVRRFGVSWIGADFGQIRGDFVVDRYGAGSRIDVAVRTDSLQGPDTEWNARLRSADWLDTQRFPEMSFHSAQVEFDDAGGAVAHGQLTLHGATRPVTLTVNRLDCTREGATSTGTCEFAASASIRRSEFGLPHGFWLAGDRVEIAISGVARHGDGAMESASSAYGRSPELH